MARKDTISIVKKRRLPLTSTTTAGLALAAPLLSTLPGLLVQANDPRLRQANREFASPCPPVTPGLHNSLPDLQGGVVPDEFYHLSAAQVAALHAQSHVLATETALGPDHIVSDLTAGHVLTALTATTAAFQNRTHPLMGPGTWHADVRVDEAAWVVLGGLITGQFLSPTSAFWAVLTPGPADSGKYLSLTGTYPNVDVVWAAGPTAFVAHPLLGATWHDDVTTGTVAAGDLIYGVGTPAKWTRLAKFTDGFVLTLASGLPAWATPAAPAAHVLAGSLHTATGLTAGDIISADSATAFSWKANPGIKVGDNPGLTGWWIFRAGSRLSIPQGTALPSEITPFTDIFLTYVDSDSKTLARLNLYIPNASPVGWKTAVCLDDSAATFTGVVTLPSPVFTGTASAAALTATGNLKGGDLYVSKVTQGYLYCEAPNDPTKFMSLYHTGTIGYITTQPAQTLLLTSNATIIQGLGAAASSVQLREYMYNGTGSTIAVGALLVGNSGGTRYVTPSTSANQVGLIGVARQGSWTTTTWGNVVYLGSCDVTCETAGAVVVGDILVAAATAGTAKTNNTPAAGTILGRALTAKAGGAAGTVTVLVQLG